MIDKKEADARLNYTYNWCKAQLSDTVIQKIPAIAPKFKYGLPLELTGSVAKAAISNPDMRKSKDGRKFASAQISLSVRQADYEKFAKAFFITLSLWESANQAKTDPKHLTNVLGMFPAFQVSERLNKDTQEKEGEWVNFIAVPSEHYPVQFSSEAAQYTNPDGSMKVDLTNCDSFLRDKDANIHAYISLGTNIKFNAEGTKLYVDARQIKFLEKPQNISVEQTDDLLAALDEEEPLPEGMDMPLEI